MSKKPNVRKPATAAKPAAMTDTQVVSLLIEVIDRAAMAGAFADLGPQGWGTIKQVKERAAALAARLAEAK